MTFWWPWPKGHGCAINKQKFACLQDKVRTTQPITTKLSMAISVVMLITWLDFKGILLETLILPNFLPKFWMCFFKVKHYWTYLRNGWCDWCEAKRRFISWILGELCALDLWPHPWPWPCSFSLRNGGAADWHGKKGCNSIVHDHDCDIWVNMVGWVDVPYSDWGDFRRRAVDISSFCIRWLSNKKQNLLCSHAHVWIMLHYQLPWATI